MVFITAEIGTNHVGSLDIAKRTIFAAKRAGADAVKFQKKDPEKIYTKEFLDSPLESPWGKTQRDMRLGRELSIDDFYEIDKYCEKLDIRWYCSCWDIETQKKMRIFETQYNKVASAMLPHIKLLYEIASEKKHTFISTGMSTENDVKYAVDIFNKFECDFHLLHCNSAYPPPNDELNLNTIRYLKYKFHPLVGYSGHEEDGYLPCLLAVAMGAKTIEKHITVDKSMYGNDQRISLTPRQFQRMVEDIQDTEYMLGFDNKLIMSSEYAAMQKLRQKFA